MSVTHPYELEDCRLARIFISHERTGSDFYKIVLALSEQALKLPRHITPSFQFLGEPGTLLGNIVYGNT